MLVIIASAILGIFIIKAEMLRPKIRGGEDFLRMSSVVYFIVFVVTQIMLQVQNLEHSFDYSFRLYKYNLNDSIFLYVELVAIIGYISILVGYYGSKNFIEFIFSLKKLYLNKEMTEKKPCIGMTSLVILGIAFGTIGLLSLMVYAKGAGGFLELIKYSAYFRSNPVVSKAAFLKNIAPFVLVSSFFFYAVTMLAETKKQKIFSKILFSFSFIFSLLVLFVQAGRLNLISYIMLFFIVGFIKNNKINWKVVIIGSVFFITIVLLGKELFHILINPDLVLNKIKTVDEGHKSVMLGVMSEFYFPIFTLANTIYVVPKIISFRYLQDLWLAVAYLLPQRLLELKLPDPIAFINTHQFVAKGGIPVDLLSVGYFSLGIIGVLILTFIYGATLRLFEKLFSPDQKHIFLVFRVAWMFFLSFRVMYGDPQVALKNCFYLLFGTFSILAIMFVHKHLAGFHPETPDGN